jgi:hypothetical protein
MVGYRGIKVAKQYTGAVAMSDRIHAKLMTQVYSLISSKPRYLDGGQIELPQHKILGGVPYNIAVDENGKIIRVKSKSEINGTRVNTEFYIDRGILYCKSAFAV